jgi:NADPH:quinone reductase-like Zn-dependent oxidoreductase
MRAYHLDQFTGADGLVLREDPEPVPGPGQALVRVYANSLNRRDLNVLRGKALRQVPLGGVPLSDGAGVVEAVGAGVSRVKAGDRVARIMFPAWLHDPLKPEDTSEPTDGMLAELVAVDGQALVKLPEHLSFEEAATLPCAAVTAWSALMGHGRPIVAGDTVLTLGSGGVSVFALQLARMAGAQVIAITSSEAKAERLKALGAAAVVNYAEQPDWDRAVRDLTGGRGVDRVVEVGGAGTLARSIRASRVGGFIAVIGSVSGGTTTSADVAGLSGTDITIQAVLVGSRDAFEDMNRALRLHQPRLVIDQVFPFAQATDAIAHFEAGKHFGKVVIGNTAGRS